MIVSYVVNCYRYLLLYHFIVLVDHNDHDCSLLHHFLVDMTTMFGGGVNRDDVLPPRVAMNIRLICCMDNY